MKLRESECERFSRLLGEKVDRELTDPEEKFLAEHGAECIGCAREESVFGDAFGALRSASMEAQVEPQFDSRLMRRVKVLGIRESFGYWLPGLVGAGIACLALFVLLHLAIAQGSPTRTPFEEPTTGQASTFVPKGPKPSLELSEVPEFDR